MNLELDSLSQCKGAQDFLLDCVRGATAFARRMVLSSSRVRSISLVKVEAQGTLTT